MNKNLLVELEFKINLIQDFIKKPLNVSAETYVQFFRKKTKNKLRIIGKKMKISSKKDLFSYLLLDKRIIAQYILYPNNSLNYVPNFYTVLKFFYEKTTLIEYNKCLCLVVNDFYYLFQVHFLQQIPFFLYFFTFIDYKKNIYIYCKYKNTTFILWTLLLDYVFRPKNTLTINKRFIFKYYYKYFSITIDNIFSNIKMVRPKCLGLTLNEKIYLIKSKMFTKIDYMLFTNYLRNLIYNAKGKIILLEITFIIKIKNNNDKELFNIKYNSKKHTIEYLYYKLIKRFYNFNIEDYYKNVYSMYFVLRVNRSSLIKIKSFKSFTFIHSNNIKNLYEKYKEKTKKKIQEEFLS